MLAPFLLLSLSPKPLFLNPKNQRQSLHNLPISKPISVTITCYSTRGIMANGKLPRMGSLAVSRDLDFLFKRKAKVSWHGRKFSVEDRMARRWRRRVDIWMASKQNCSRFGKRKGRLNREIFSRWEGKSSPAGS